VAATPYGEGMACELPPEVANATSRVARRYRHGLQLGGDTHHLGTVKDGSQAIPKQDGGGRPATYRPGIMRKPP
jgi:hypothetical protein